MTTAAAPMLKLRCLIVDDSPAFLAAASTLLEREGVSIVGVASTIAEALDRVAELQPDVTLVDIDLGGESGFDLVRLLSGSGGPSSKVILVSSYAEQDFADLIAESPASGFVAKSDLSTQAIYDVLSRQS